MESLAGPEAVLQTQQVKSPPSKSKDEAWGEQLMFSFLWLDQTVHDATAPPTGDPSCDLVLLVNC